MVLLTMPEGSLFYGEIYTDLLGGMLQACADADAPGGLHVLTEGTYHQTDPASLAAYPETVADAIVEQLPGKVAEYWTKHCTVALGAWPLGYYREVRDASGKVLGWSGRKETFGDRIVGSYADKSGWYPPDEFARQMAGLAAFSPRYNWVYAHGATFWQLSEEEAARYARRAHKSMSNATLPVVKDLQAYLDAIGARKTLREAPGESR